MTDPRAPSTGTAYYTYGVVPLDFPAGALEGAQGVGARPVELVGGDAVAALTSLVSLDEFGEEPLHANLNDREWLERTARAHEDVLERALSAAPVIPFRLCTVYRGRDQVLDLLSERGATFAGLLDRLRGTVELGVKAYLDRARFLEAAGAAPAPASPSGREYMLRRQRERTLDEEREQFKAECARSSHERLAAVALAAQANPPQPPEVSGRTDEMLLNGAYLVEAADGPLAEAVAELEGAYGPRGVSYELTGPWPPYNFVPRDLAET